MLLRRIITAVLASGVLAAAPLLAQKPANAPKNATAECKDGTFSTAKTERGACSKHGGVKSWWGAGSVVAPKATPPKSTTTAPPKGGSSTKGGTTATASAPKGATGQCADGTYTKAKTQKGACSQHGGVKTWFASSGSTPSTAAPARTSQPPNAAPTPAPAAPSKPATPTNTQAPTTKAAPADAPQGATAKCKDGTFSMAKQHRGACSRHGGVAEWYK
jgi:hypothetical protein